MVFSSIPFLFYFLPIFLLIYFLVPTKIKNMVLLIFSLIFYGWGEPVYISLLIISSVVDYCNGRMMEKFCNEPKKRKIFLIGSVVINLGLLGVFKYCDLFISTINGIAGSSIPLTDIALPIGISFFTFQTMSYSIDVYRNTVKAEHNFIDYMAYVSMFPQLVAGPIVRYEEVQKELKCRKVTFDNAADGCIRFFLGLFKKVLIANQIGQLWDMSYANMGNLSVAGAWIGVIAYALQIYFDFSGYSDMAIGLGKIMGFTYPENFNYPYISSSITEFWRRWHISLSQWFKSYVYIPLGGNRKGIPRTIINLFIVWSLTGFWHGAGWNFLLWGIYFAVILILEKFVLAKVLEKIPLIVKRIVTLVLLLISWVMFAATDFPSMSNYFSHMFGISGNAIVNEAFIYNLRNYGFIIIIGGIAATPIYPKICKSINGSQWKDFLYIIGMIIFLMLFAMTISFLVNNTYNPFLYFRF